jgi:hypothetical protein
MTVPNATDILSGLKGIQFTNETNACMWVNGNGSAERADYIPGLGYFLVKEDKKMDGQTGSATIQLLLREPEVQGTPLPLALKRSLGTLRIIVRTKTSSCTRASSMER